MFMQMRSRGPYGPRRKLTPEEEAQEHRVERGLLIVAGVIMFVCLTFLMLNWLCSWRL